MPQRKIELTIHPDVKPSHIHDEALQQAIAYAAMWGNPAEVHIYVDKDCGVSARYLNEARAQTFYMEGLRNHCHPDKPDHDTCSIRSKYCFHS